MRKYLRKWFLVGELVAITGLIGLGVCEALLPSTPSMFRGLGGLARAVTYGAVFIVLVASLITLLICRGIQRAREKSHTPVSPKNARREKIIATVVLGGSVLVTAIRVIPSGYIGIYGIDSIDSIETLLEIIEMVIYDIEFITIYSPLSVIWIVASATFLLAGGTQG